MFVVTSARAEDRTYLCLFRREGEREKKEREGEKEKLTGNPVLQSKD